MENPVAKKASRLRTAIPQVLAVSAKNLILFDLGMCIAFPTIVIPAVQNSSGSLSLDDEQTSWFGSISLICQPVGSVMSGLLLERLGRKLSMMLVNVPMLLAWVLFYFVDTPNGLLATSAVMGLSMGIVEAPVLTYVAEVSQPHLRGMLTSFTELGVCVGIFCQYLIGTVTDWRTTAAISTAIPIISIIAISQVPESPAWLMSRGRSKEAERSLCWLRGWVSPDAVRAELSDLEAYYSRPTLAVSNQAFADSKADVNGDVQSSTEKILTSASGSPSYDNVLENLRAMLRPETLRPLAMVLVMSLLEHWCGVSSTRPFMVQVFHEFGLPIDAHWATVVTSILSICGVAVCLVAVPWCGKRPLLFLSVAGVVLCCVLLGTYAYLALPNGSEVTNWMPFALFITLFFTHSMALNPMPWMLLSEIFPFRTRSLAAGTAAAINYVFAFVASKTFLGMKTGIGLHGVYWLYAAVTAVGSIYLMFEFKETEGKTLGDIEDIYKKKSPSSAAKPMSSTYLPRIMRDDRTSEDDALKWKMQEGEQAIQSNKAGETSTNCDDDDEDDGHPPLPMKQNGGISQQLEESPEMKSEDYSDIAVDRTETDGKSEVQKESPVSVVRRKEDREDPDAVHERQEELDEIKESPEEFSTTIEMSCPTGKGTEIIAMNNRATRPLPSLPCEVQLRRDKSSEDVDGTSSNGKGDVPKEKNILVGTREDLPVDTLEKHKLPEMEESPEAPPTTIVDGRSEETSSPSEIKVEGIAMTSMVARHLPSSEGFQFRRDEKSPDVEDRR